MIPRSSILLLMLPTLLLSDVPFTRVESGKLDGVGLPSSRKVAARFIGTPLRRHIRMISKSNAMNEGEPPIRLRSPIHPMRNIYYYGDNQQLSRASGRFHGKAHAFPTHSIPTPQLVADEAILPSPPTYDPKRHHRDKLISDDRLMDEAADLARGLERTTMRVRTFADIDVKKTTTPLPAVTVTKISKKDHEPTSSMDRSPSLASSPSSSLGPPAPPLRSIAREQQRILLQQQQSPLLLAARSSCSQLESFLPYLLPFIPNWSTDSSSSPCRSSHSHSPQSPLPPQVSNPPRSSPWCPSTSYPTHSFSLDQQSSTECLTRAVGMWMGLGD
ncbi:hypothetical protein PMAYCL1PPCAC_29780 [Pristionchus mayeri]|uniref:Uncharacterized protein n=1 Tax=Pristionchus mayeri TaxID=1317129 RepID=A0AAN5DBK1_9BILA|nr:hypothetical protein PMAYCL1PPCAC_29780 [Pristionchus mayeri]